MTKEKLIAKIADMEKAIPQLQANLNATLGAIQFAKQMLAAWDEAEPSETEGQSNAEPTE